MEIYPRTQLTLVLLSFLAGVTSGVLLLLFSALRTLLGAYRPPDDMRRVYERPLPLLRRAPVFRVGAARRAWSVGVTALLDVLFCLTLCVAEILLLYDYNDGAVWPFSVLALLAGLAAWRACMARVTERLVAYLAYGLAVLSLYLRALLLLPFYGLRRLWIRVILSPVRRMAAAAREKRFARQSESLCREQLAMASDGFKKTKEGNTGREKGKEALPDGDCDPRARGARVLHLSGAHGQASRRSRTDPPRHCRHSRGA